MLRIWEVRRWGRWLGRRGWIGGSLDSNITKMFLPAAMLVEQASWKGTLAGLAARNVMSIATRTVRTSSPSQCSWAITYHGEWKSE